MSGTALGLTHTWLSVTQLGVGGGGIGVLSVDHFLGGWDGGIFDWGLQVVVANCHVKLQLRGN